MRKDKIVMEKDQLEKLYAEYGSLNKVAKALNCSAKTIKRRMDELKLEYQTKIEYSCNDNYFSTHGPAQAYWAGFLITDGCVMHRNYSYLVYLGLAKKDIDHLEKFKKATQSTAPIHENIFDNIIFPGKTEPSSKTYYRATITITSEKMFQDLSKYNVVPQKTYICSFPDWLVDNEYCSHFLRGVMDGDGWISIKNNEDPKIGFVGTPKLISKIKEIIDNKVLSEPHGYYAIRDKTALLEYAGKKIISKLIEYLYQDADESIWLKRKRDVVEKILIDCKPFVGLDLQKEQLQELYQKHKTISGVAEEMGHSLDVIKKYMTLHNLEWNHTTAYEHNHSFFSEANESPEQFYWAGYLLGNSTIDGKHIIITSTDKSVLEKMLATEMIGTPINQNKNVYRISFTSEQIVKDLERFNIFADKKTKYSLPEWLINHSYLHHFLRGRLEVRRVLSVDLKSLELTGPLEYLQQLKKIFQEKCEFTDDPTIGSRAIKNSNRMTFSSPAAKLIYNYLNEN